LSDTANSNQSIWRALLIPAVLCLLSFAVWTQSTAQPVPVEPGDVSPPEPVEKVSTPEEPPATRTEENLTRLPPNANTFPFLAVDVNARTVRIQSGIWQVSESIILPDGFSLEGGAGTTLDLSNSASVLCRGAVFLVGEPDSPFVLISNSKTGHGLVVINAVGGSAIKHAAFSGLQAPASEGWSVSGALTFHGSNISVESSRFVGCSADDALKLMRCTFTLKDVQFRNNTGDALNVANSEGLISNCRFESIGGDGIDLSGSTLQANDLYLSQIGDKAVSTGEVSRATFTDTTILQTQVAFASKNLSALTITNAQIANCRVGLTAYQAKKNSGPATIHATGIEKISVDTPYLIEKGSSVVVDDRAVPTVSRNVSRILYGIDGTPE
jgi:hypothetical protein